MRDYGKVHTSFWSSATVRSMSEDGRMLAMYLLTCPHATITGVMRLPDGYICEDLQWSIERVSEGFAELFRKGFANRCETTKWVWVRKYLDWNTLENPNQRKSALKIAKTIPAECSWKFDFSVSCGGSIGLLASNPSETVPQPFANQEQEQEQEKDSLSETSSDAPPKKSGSEKYPAAFEAFWQAYPRSPNMSKSKALAGWKKLTEEERAACAAAVPAYKAFLASKTDHPTMHATTFISERRFEGFSPEPAAAPVPVDDDRWKKRLVYAREKAAWPTAWGPCPSQPGCGVPAHILEPNDGLNWAETETIR